MHISGDCKKTIKHREGSARPTRMCGAHVCAWSAYTCMVIINLKCMLLTKADVGNRKPRSASESHHREPSLVWGTGEKGGDEVSWKQTKNGEQERGPLPGLRKVTNCVPVYAKRGRSGGKWQGWGLGKGRGGRGRGQMRGTPKTHVGWKKGEEEGDRAKQEDQGPVMRI